MPTEMSHPGVEGTIQAVNDRQAAVLADLGWTPTDTPPAPAPKRDTAPPPKES